MAKRKEYEELPERSADYGSGGVSYERAAAPTMPDSYGTAYAEALQRYAEPEKFSYEYQSDPRWAAYKKEYARAGRRAAAHLGRTAGRRVARFDRLLAWRSRLASRPPRLDCGKRRREPFGLRCLPSRRTLPDACGARLPRKAWHNGAAENRRGAH